MMAMESAELTTFRRKWLETADLRVHSVPLQSCALCCRSLGIPSRIAAIGIGPGHVHCAGCGLLAMVSYLGGCALFRSRLEQPDRRPHECKLDGLEAVYNHGKVFEQEIRWRRPRGPSRRTPLASDLVIVVLFNHGLSDFEIHGLLKRALAEGRIAIPGVKEPTTLNDDYVKHWRNRSPIPAGLWTREYERAFSVPL
jgi:hypothetical protein